MQTGKLRHRLELQSLGETRDAHGGIARLFSTFATVWGQVRPLRGEELIHAQGVESRTTHEIRIRRRTDMVPESRVIHLTRTFNVLSVLDRNERHRENVLSCVEVND